jgi:hypothetical protein
VSVSAYPLTWPDTLPRSAAKASSQFKASLSAALKNVEDSLRRFGADSGGIKDVIISSNVTLGASRPTDPGVAVWFTWAGEQRCIAVDRYPKVEDNLQAIHPARVLGPYHRHNGGPLNDDDAPQAVESHSRDSKTSRSRRPT